MGKGLAQKYPEPIGRRVTGWGQVRVEKQPVEGSDPHGGHGCVCEGDTACVGVSHPRAEVKLLCFRLLSSFLKLV
jgi:hypothetical protein